MPDQHPITRALTGAIMQSSEPMVLSDPALPDHPLTVVNAAFAAVSLYPPSETIGRNCRFLQGPDTDGQTSARIRRCIAEQRGCVEWIVNYRRDGTKFWNLLFLSPVFDRDGTLLHFIGNQRDITNGPPAALPDYTLGRADMTLDAEMDFQALLLDLLDAGRPPEDSAEGLQRLIEAARRLDAATTQLAPAAWELPRA